MIQKINNKITKQKNGTLSSANIYIVDYKNLNRGLVEVLDKKPDNNCVHLDNEQRISIYFVAFLENALIVDEPHGQVKQCECVLFPSSLNAEDWVLFIETKYSKDLKTALNENIDYPNTMIDQIISTVKYFRENEILQNDKKVHAIVSFPRLIEAFSEAFFTRSRLTREELVMNYKISLRATNEGKIISQKRIKI